MSLKQITSTSGKTIVEVDKEWSCVCRDFMNGKGLFIFGVIPKHRGDHEINIIGILDAIENIVTLPSIGSSETLSYRIPFPKSYKKTDDRIHKGVPVKIGHFKRNSYGSIDNCCFVVRWG